MCNMFFLSICLVACFVLFKLGPCTARICRSIYWLLAMKRHGMDRQDLPKQFIDALPQQQQQQQQQQQRLKQNQHQRLLLLLLLRFSVYFRLSKVWRKPTGSQGARIRNADLKRPVFMLLHKSGKFPLHHRKIPTPKNYHDNGISTIWKMYFSIAMSVFCECNGWKLKISSDFGKG